MKKKILFLLILLVPFLVSAKSEYYEHMWTYDVDSSFEYIGFVTNDIIDYNDGYIAVGFKNEDMAAFVLDADGEYVKEVNLKNHNHGKAKRIFEVSDGYVIISVAGPDVVVTKLDSNLKYQYEEYYNADGAFEWGTDLYAIKADEKVYMWNSHQYESGILVYDNESGEISSIRLSKVPQPTRQVLSGYFEVQEYENCHNYNLVGALDSQASGKLVATPLGTMNNYCIIFEHPYKDGYIFGLNGDGKGLLVRYEDDELFTKTFNNFFLKDGVQFRNNIIVTGVSYNTDESQLLVINESGKTLETTPISDYVDDEYFIPEHLIPTKNGFALTGSVKYCNVNLAEQNAINTNKKVMPTNLVDEKEPPAKPEGEPPAKPEGEPPAKPEGGNGEVLGDENGCYDDKILYFSADYLVETKTDGNGEVKASRVRANDGDAIEFTVTPKEGYVLGEVKVTDSNGNVVIFTDYKFTMPSADVLIEATFIPINPNTSAISVTLIVILSIIFGIGLIVAIKKFKWQR